jgi:hypothetical protein
MTRYILILVLLSFLPVPVAEAQQGGSAFIEQVQERAPGEVSQGQALRMLHDNFFLPSQARAGNGLALGLDDGGNTSLVQQFGDGNTAELAQRGQGNFAWIVQRGARNTTRATQEGDRNVQASRLLGDDNTLDITQLGDGNAYVLGFQGNDLNHSVVQEGQNNFALQEGVGELPFGIQQRGNDMAIEIRHNQ